MKHLELDTLKIAQLGEQNEEENFDFRIFLKGQDSKKIDKIVGRLNKELTTLIDCQKCGNCCTSLRPCITKSEIKKLAHIEHSTQADFVSRYLEKDSFEEIHFLKDTPCKFLKDKSCTIYPDRPLDCKSFPHTQKPDFNSRTLEMIDNYGICPIVFNLLEELKNVLNYRRYQAG